MRLQLAALLCVLSASSAAFAGTGPVNLVSNGSFASGTTGWTNTVSFTPPTHPTDTEFGANSVSFIYPATLPDGFTTFGYVQASGSYYGYTAPGDNTASTALSSSLISGDTYDYSFYYDARSEFSSPVGTFNVYIGDQTLFTTTAVSNTTSFVYVSGSFVADGSSSTLNLENISSSDASIDVTGLDVNLAPSPTPEPSSLVLLGTGVIGMFGAARRRLRKA